MTKPLVFLDFDGVLNSYSWFVSQGVSVFPTILDRERIGFDPDTIKQLNRLLAESEANVVVSSAWRTSRSLPKLQELLEKSGFEGRIVGKTPDLGCCRGEEILSWIRMSSFDGPFIVLDDICQVEEVRKHFIKTDPAVGLQDSQVEKALEMLG